MIRRVVLIAAVLLIGGVSPLIAGNNDPTELDIISWNVESGGSDSEDIGVRIAAFTSIDLWGLSEVQNAQAAAIFQTAAGEGETTTFNSVLSQSGGGDRLLILYDSARFESLDEFELTDINIGGNARAPLVAHLRDRASEQEFFFMVNHLHRGNAYARYQQARMLNDWAEQASLPVIAVGDYNFDYEVIGGNVNHDLGFDYMTEDHVFEWVQPSPLVRTQCSVLSVDQTCEFNSVLDFVFVSGAIQSWVAKSEIIVASGDFPDNAGTSDHRPLRVQFEIPAAPPAAPPVDKQQILDRIAQIEQELADLRELVEQLP